jgi:hypothetical protein
MRFAKALGSYVAGERGHRQDLSEHALVVAIHKATQSSETRNRCGLAICQ